MSGVYIKLNQTPLPLPYGHRISILSDGHAYYEDGASPYMDLGKVIEVPDHGRLVDADAILNSKGVGTQIAGWGTMYHETVIEFAPTIIPASGKEEDE